MTGLTGLLMLADLFLESKDVSAFASLIRDYVVIIFGFAICLGGANLIMIHGNEIRKRAPGRLYSTFLLCVMFAYVAIGSILTPNSTVYNWLFQTINNPLAQVGNSLLAFYIFSAAIRAFMARNWEASAFLVCGLLAIIGNIPSIPFLSPELAAIGPWIQDNPARGAFLGLLVTAALGGIVLALRTLLGRESGYLGRA